MALIPSKDGYTVTTEFPEHQTQTQDIPVVRPSGYDLFAVARLDGVGFAISPQGDQVRSLPIEDAVTWHWSLMPQETGQQRLSVTLLLRWVPLAGTAGSTREAVAYSTGLNVRVLSFFGLKRGQAMLIGLLGLIFGGGLSIFALVYRPRPSLTPTEATLTSGVFEAQRDDLRVLQPGLSVVVELPATVELSADERALLQTLFKRYARLVVQSEFLSGYSGARTFLLLPIRSDGRADAYTIAKIGDRKAIQREYRNYQTYVEHTLPPITARIQHPPVSVPQGDKGALQYTFIAEPGSTPASLRQALLAEPDPALLDKLFKVFGPNWWMQRQAYTFRLAQEYDRALPPHYVLEPHAGEGQILDGRSSPSPVSLALGESVRLRNFPLTEVRHDGRSFSLTGETTPGQPPLRVRWMGEVLSEGLSGRVVATRETLLSSYAADFDRYGLPDPLAKLSHLLDESVVGSRSTIHGDLNLENVLVGPGDFLWLIDFAETRDGHPLADFAHLETEIIAHIIAPQITAPEVYLAALRGEVPQALAPYYTLRGSVHEIASRCQFDASQGREYQLALYISCLGALKYRNMNAHQKHLLYLSAAHLTQEL
jgi:hypothetical protein